MVVKVGDRLSIKTFNYRHEKIETGKIVKEYEHHFLLINKNYSFSLNKIDLMNSKNVVIEKLQ